MDQLGAELKQAREARKISIHEMATRTKIGITALECLERNDFSKLPGGIFGRAFVRAYAMEVGMEPDSTVSRFSEMLEQIEREAAERKAASRPEITLDDRQFLARQQRALLLLRIVIVVVVLAGLALAGLQVRAYLRRRAEAATPATQVIPTPLPSPSALPLTAPPDATVSSAVPVTAAPLENAAVAALAVEFELSGESWVSVGVDGKAPMARLFQAGDHQRIEADREVLLDVGNAGVVRLVINGRRAKPLGRDGAHERTRITRENFAAFLE